MLVPAVAQAITDLHTNFPDHEMLVKEDGAGGAFVTVQGMAVGPACEPVETWVGFRLVYQYPYADIYPYYVRPDLQRVDGAALGATVDFDGQAAIQISRRSNHRDAAVDTAVLKLQRIIEWLTASR